MTAFDRIDLQELTEVLRRRGLDGWLVYDFHGVNPMAARLLGPTGMLTRRLFLWLSAVAPPRLIIHNIDTIAVPDFPGDVAVYTTWQDLHQCLSSVVRGRRVAMEISPDNAVPYLDRVPSGLVELLTRLGAIVVPSDALVTRFAARWSPAEVAEHRRTAETIATIARETMRRVVAPESGVQEYRVQRDILAAFDRAGLQTEDPPVVAFGAHAADPHYSPNEQSSVPAAPDQVILIDLWARPSPTSVWADQTWMGFSGGALPSDVTDVWHTVRGARDAAVDHLVRGLRQGESVTGAELDRAARALVEQAGYGAAFVHRTGHSIEQDLHGSGPHIDDFETHDTRELTAGVAFSIEPGIYLAGRYGMRSEINVIVGEGAAEVTPSKPQQDLITPA